MEKSSSTPSSAISVLKRLHVNVIGEKKPPVLFCNGFNCNQHIWNYLTPALARHYQLVFFDQMGTGGSDVSAYDAQQYATLASYAGDVVAICQALDLHDAVVVGHSIGAMIGLLAAVQAPQHFSKVVLLAATPHYLNEPAYHGGFERADLLALLDEMDRNYQSWATTFATLLIGPGQPASLGYELAGYFCQADPTIAKQFARIGFLADNRADLSRLHLPTLLLQCSEDVAVPEEVSAYMLAHLPQAQLVTLQTTGHCPHLSAPFEVVAALRAFIG
ncbi:alpha/beta fold hydrolase [Hymenobacter ginsengisoli]|uniref:alpha/beta fold hydrolase n=1 Tax=Hymenobacter sp. KCTC 23674 TaxID=2864219 RepID=UPI001C69D39D|nr:alpha/beta hydrolase [Hymenobacter sp. KCTC 23674]